MTHAMADDRVLEAEGLLMALLPGLGPRAALGSPLGVLKWAGPHPLAVECSTLEFLDGAGRVVERRDGAFGLASGTSIAAPYSQLLADDRDPPRAAETQRWRLNDCTLATRRREPDAAWPSLVVICLPLILPLAEDHHFIARLVNLGTAPLDIARGMREAVCWMDGEGWPSIAGRVWNGPYRLHPGHTATRRFRLADFPGAPATGTHDVALEMLGRRSAPQRIHWHGTPWQPPEAGGGQ